MSKVIVSNLMTVDGFVAGPGGDVMSLPFDDSFSTHNLGLLLDAGTLLYGATTYAGMRDYWPAVAEDDSQPEVERAIARRSAEIDKLVVSDSLTGDDTGPWAETTTILRRDEAHERIAELRRDGKDDILTFGSITLVNDLLAAGLVDEMQVLVGAGVLLDGVPAFSQPPAQAFTLVDARKLRGSNTALLRYAFED
ncbi:dihydrofolate reductase family protein [Aeromicrobium sp.]|uniref:dihydrofolate reductase family protein n=1 Tax=Aeromicrobium sp. TaxID=1871063 RepID=UPI003C357F82